MATTSYLYHAVGLRDHKHQHTQYVGGTAYHHVRRKRHDRRRRFCSGQGMELQLFRPFERRFHAPPIGVRQQIIVLHGYHQACSRCGRSAREPVPLAPGQV